MGFDGAIRINTKIDQSGVAGGLVKMESALQRFAGVASTIFAGISIGSFAQSAIKSTADIELATVKLETLLGNAEAAQQMIADIVHMADVTPYNSQDLIQAAVTLKTFGITAQDIIPTLEALGNAAGGQADQLAGIARALGQTKAQGKMMTQDMYQFVNAGVPLLKLLSEELKKPTAEISKMVEAGQIGYQEVNGALQKFYTGNGKYAGLMAKAAQTLSGMFSTMQDGAMSFGRSVVAIFEPSLKKMMDAVTKGFTVLKDWVTGLSEGTKNGILTFVKYAGIFLISVAAMSAALLAISFINPFALIVGGAAILITAFAQTEAGTYLFKTVFDGLLETGQQLKIMFNELAITVNMMLAPFNTTGKELRITGGAFDTLTESIKYLLIPLKAFVDYSMWIMNNLVGQTAVAGKSVSGYLKDAMAQWNSAKFGTKKTFTENNTADPKALTAAQLKAAEDEKKLQQEVTAWYVGEYQSRTDQELYLLEQKYQEELKLANGNEGLELQLLQRKNKMRQDIIEKSLHYSTAFSFLIGIGMSEELARGLDEGLHTVTSAVKNTVEMMARAFEAVWSVFEGAFNILSWMSDFKPADLLKSLKSFLDGITDFFMNDIGALPIFFDTGMKMIEDMIDGIFENLPAIVDSIGNVIDHICNYLIDKGPTLLKKALTIVLALVMKLIQKLPEIFNAFLGLFITMIQFIANHAQELARSLTDALLQMVIITITHLPEIVTALFKIATGMTAGIVQGLVDTITHTNWVNVLWLIVTGLIAAIPQIIGSLTMACYDIGKAIVQGIIDGIGSIGETIWAWMVAGFNWLINAICGFFGIASPSKLFEGFGKDIVLGLIGGIGDVGKAIWDAIWGGFQYLLKLAEQALNVGSQIGKALVNGIISAFSDLTAWFSNFFNALFKSMDFVGNLASQVADAVVSAIGGGITDTGGDVVDYFTGLTSGGDWIPGGDWFASGTDSAPGGLSMVGEKGPELVNLPRGAQVIPNDILRALSSMTFPQTVGGGGQTINLSVQVTGDTSIDGQIIAHSVFKNIDKEIRLAYGNS
jgi:tape measure domain-containing protein